MAPPDVIRLSVPARAHYARLARATAAGLARRRGFSSRAIEDLQLAIDEALIVVLGGPNSTETEVMHLMFGLEPDAITVEAESAGRDPGASVEKAATRLGRLVSDLVDEFSVSDDGTKVRLVKRRT